MGTSSRYLAPKSRRRTGLARLSPKSRPSTSRWCWHCITKKQNPRFWSLNFRACLNRLGIGINLPRLRQTRRRKRCPHPPCSKKTFASQSASVQLQKVLAKDSQSFGVVSETALATEPSRPICNPSIRSNVKVPEPYQVVIAMGHVYGPSWAYQ